MIKYLNFYNATNNLTIFGNLENRKYKLKKKDNNNHVLGIILVNYNFYL